jgi:mono/diheme cytochrome c family protein
MPNLWGIVVPIVVLLVFVLIVLRLAELLQPTRPPEAAEEVTGARAMERKVGVVIALSAAIGLFLVFYAVNEPNRQAAAVVRQEHLSVERGVRNYTTLCYGCHGNDGRGAVVPGSEPPRVAPALNRPDFRAEGKSPDEVKRTYDFIFRTIARGRPNTPMPAWSDKEGGSLLDEEIHELTLMIMKGDWQEVVRAAREAQAHGAPTPIPATGLIAGATGPDAEAQRLFIAKGCGGCHTLSAVPGAVGTTGPNLNGIGTRAAERKPGTSAEDYIRESILNPTAYVVQGFQPIMPSFQGQLSDEELRTLVDFLLKQK